MKVYKQRPNIVALMGAESDAVVVKWFGWRNPVHYYLSPTFPGRALTSWTVAHALKQVAARTPEPLFVYSRRSRGLIQENFFITEGIYPHKTLRSFLKSDAPDQDKMAAVKDLAGSIVRMHNGGSFHRDLTTANFLVNEKLEVYIIDLNRASLLARLSLRQRLVDLARLNFADAPPEAETRLRQVFFNEYGRAAPHACDWEQGYLKYRARLQARRRLKSRLRRLGHPKQANMMGV